MTAPPSISADEVRATARFPHRGALADGALVTAAGALLLWLAGQRSLPVAPEGPAFDAEACQVVPLPEPCLQRLPPELRDLPERTQYERWRRWDLAQKVELPLDLPRPEPQRWLGKVLDGRSDRERVLQALQELDPWSDWRLTEELPSGPDAALLALSSERDWSAPVPGLQPLPTAAELEERYSGPDLLVALDVLRHNEESRLLISQIVRQRGARYEQQRQWARQVSWRHSELEEVRRQVTYLHALRTASAERALFEAVAVASLVFAAFLTAAWAWLKPVTVVAGLHHLQFGQRRIFWSEIQRISWGGRDVEVHTAARSYGLWPWALSQEATDALARASEQALARAATLDPVDNRALDEVRRLSAAKESAGPVQG